LLHRSETSAEKAAEVRAGEQFQDYIGCSARHQAKCVYLSHVRPDMGEVYVTEAPWAGTRRACPFSSRARRTPARR